MLFNPGGPTTEYKVGGRSMIGGCHVWRVHDILMTTHKKTRKHLAG